jgi:hypothetical protein
MATLTGLDRDRAFYPTVTIVIGALYVLFAAMGGSAHALVFELLGGAVFLIAAIVGFKSSLWIVAVALAAHGIFDFFHGWMIQNAGVPSWWPGFCSTYDVTAAVYLGGLLQSGRVSAKAVKS